MTPEQVKFLIEEGEGLTVEFKERYTSRIDEDIVAFANSKGGTLLLGVRNDGNVSGERLTNDLKAKVNSLARNCNPSITVKHSQVGKIVAIVVPEGMEKPYSCSSGYYRRLDATTQKMSHDELRIMVAENEPLPFEERTVKGFAFEDISEVKIHAFVKEAGIRISTIPVPEFLCSLWVANEAQVKNAGILFFAQNVYDHLHSPELAMKEGPPGISETEKRTGAKTAQKTTQKTAQKIRDAIRQNPEITRQELARELGITDSGVKYHLKKLQEKGLLGRIGHDKGGHWEVIRINERGKNA